MALLKRELVGEKKNMNWFNFVDHKLSLNFSKVNYEHELAHFNWYGLNFELAYFFCERAQHWLFADTVASCK